MWMTNQRLHHFCLGRIDFCDTIQDLTIRFGIGQEKPDRSLRGMLKVERKEKHLVFYSCHLIPRPSGVVLRGFCSCRDFSFKPSTALKSVPRYNSRVTDIRLES